MIIIKLIESLCENACIKIIYFDMHLHKNVTKNTLWIKPNFVKICE
jgi:hypothetical protein